MEPYWINLNTFWGNSKSFTIDDPSIWAEPIAEFNMDCIVTTPLSGTVLLHPQEKGCLISGKLIGQVTLPCNLCIINTEVTIKHLFKNFEPFPSIDEHSVDNKINNLIIRQVNGIYEASLASILWEEFALSLPVNPICKLDCKGLCHNCGKDRNKENCICIEDKIDSRFAALKNLKRISPSLTNYPKL